MTENSEGEEALKDILGYLVEISGSALASGLLSTHDKEIVLKARRDLHQESQTAHAVLTALRKADAADYRIACLSRLLEAAIAIASRGLVTSPVKQHVEKTQAKSARDRLAAQRMQTPEEQAISIAIEAAKSDWNGKKPYKLAEAIANDLEKKGIKRSKRAIVDRLKNRSS